MDTGKRVNWIPVTSVTNTAPNQFPALNNVTRSLMVLPLGKPSKEYWELCVTTSRLNHLKVTTRGSGEATQWWRALVLAEVLGSVPSTQRVARNHPQLQVQET